MAKKKKKKTFANSRGYATTSVKPKAIPVPVTSDSVAVEVASGADEKQGAEVQKEVKGRLIQASDVIAPFDITQLPRAAKVTRKSEKVAGVFSSLLSVNLEVENNVYSKLLSEEHLLRLLDENIFNCNYMYIKHRNDKPKKLEKLYISTYLGLKNLKFSETRIQSCMDICGFDMVRCLDYLVLHGDDQTLPKGWYRVLFKEKPQPAIADQTEDETVTQKQNAVTKPIVDEAAIQIVDRVQEYEDNLYSNADDLKLNNSLRYVAYLYRVKYLKECMKSEQDQRAFAQREITWLNKQLKQLRGDKQVHSSVEYLVFKYNEQLEVYNSLGNEKAQNKMEKPLGQLLKDINHHLSLNPMLTVGAVQKGLAIVKTQQTERPVVACDFDHVKQLRAEQTASASVADTSVDEGTDDGGLCLFNEEEAGEEAEADSYSSGYNIMECAVDKAYRGATPVKVVAEYFNSSNKAVVKYRRRTEAGPKFLFQYELVIKCNALNVDEFYQMKEKEFCSTEAEAKDYVSLLALFDIYSSSATLVQRFPKVFQQLWRQWSLQRKIDENQSYVECVDYCKAKAAATLVGAGSSSTVDTATVRAAVPGSRRGGGRDTRADREAIIRGYQQRVESKAYQKLKPVQSALPVFKHKRVITGEFGKHDVMIVCGATGSGKTTQVPQMVLEEELAAGRDCNIVVTEPRRISAISIAERVSEEMGDPRGVGGAGSLVGFHIRGERKCGSSNRLVFCTTGILLRQLKTDTLLSQYTVVIVDEVHERTVQSDYLLIVLKQVLYQRNRPGSGLPRLKVILMSATLNADKFKAFFNNYRTCVVEVEGRSFPVSNFTLEDVIQLTGYRVEADSDYALRGKATATSTAAVRVNRVAQTVEWVDDDVDWLYGVDKASDTELSEEMQYYQQLVTEYDVDTLRTLRKVDQKRVNLDLIEDLLLLLADPAEHESNSNSFSRLTSALDTLSRSDNIDNNAVLVFLPGISDITKLFDRLSGSRLFGDASKYLILPLHSSLTASSKEQAKVFQLPPPGVVKVVLATNIAETGVTIPDVAYVIDCGRVKEISYDTSKNMKKLQECFVSRANALQRRGRAGRVRPGICFNLLSARTYEKVLKSYTTPEIQRIPLDDLCLDILIMRYNPVEFLGNALDPPKLSAVKASVSYLAEVGAVEIVDDGNDDNDGESLVAYEAGQSLKVTALGFHLSLLPLDVKVGKMLIYGAIFKCIDPILTIAASVNCASPFLTPQGKQQEANKRKEVFRLHDSDLLTIYNVYCAWLKLVEANRGSVYATKVKSFCFENFLSNKALTEIRQVRRELTDLLVEIGFLQRGAFHKANVYSTQPTVLSAVICAGLYPNVAYKSKAQKHFLSRANEPLQLSKNSLVCEASTGSRDRWICFSEVLKTVNAYIMDATLVGVNALSLFANAIDVEYDHGRLVLNDWIVLEANPRTAVLLKVCQRLLRLILLEKFRSPNTSIQQYDQFIDLVVQLL